MKLEQKLTNVGFANVMAGRERTAAQLNFIFMLMQTKNSKFNEFKSIILTVRLRKKEKIKLNQPKLRQSNIASPLRKELMKLFCHFLLQYTKIYIEKKQTLKNDKTKTSMSLRDSPKGKIPKILNFNFRTPSPPP